MAVHHPQMPEFLPGWRIPRRRKIAVVSVAFVSVVAGVAGYKINGQGGSKLSYEDKCAKICQPLSSRVRITYLDPNNQNGGRTVPREVQCMCGSSVLGKPLY